MRLRNEKRNNSQHALETGNVRTHTLVSAHGAHTPKTLQHDKRKNFRAHQRWSALDRADRQINNCAEQKNQPGEGNKEHVVGNAGTVSKRCILDKKGEVAQLRTEFRKSTYTEYDPILYGSIDEWKRDQVGEGNDVKKPAARDRKRLAEVLWDVECNDPLMCAHMVPKRFGGLGDTGNVRPWTEKFETGDWLRQVENPFDTAVRAVAIGDNLRYDVTVHELPNSVVDRVMSDPTVIAKHHNTEPHRRAVERMPVSVDAKVGRVNNETHYNSDNCNDRDIYKVGTDHGLSKNAAKIVLGLLATLGIAATIALLLP